jgi:hypothetical protein
MTATYDLSTNIGKVRLLIGDKVIDSAHFTDEELSYFLSENSASVNLAAAAALEAWAADLSETMTSETIGDYSYSKKVVQNKLDLAKSLRDKAESEPIIDWTDFGETE